VSRLLLAACLAIAVAQATPPRFQAGVEVVRVNVLVTDDNRPVAGLTAADFELRDSSVVQQVESATFADIPVSMSLVLDISQSVRGRTLEHLKEAAGAALDQLAAPDRAALLTFHSAVDLQADWGPPSSAIRTALHHAEAGGGTALYDAAFSALTMTGATPGNRELVLLFSDGADTASWLSSSAVLERARRAEPVVYSVMLGTPSDSRLLYGRSGVELLEGQVPLGVVPPFLSELSSVTGGSTFVAEGAAGLRRAFARIVTEFRTRYLLTYTPRGVDAGGWHPIDVKLRNKKGKVTARRGYWSG
jgi:Ca-activated chloride channel family protein